MGSGVNRKVTGAFIGTGSADVDVRTVGFRPSEVRLYNETAVATAYWQDTMADGEMFKRVTAGDGTLVTSTGITPLSDGFRVGQDADLNTAAEKVHWVAYE